MPRKKKSEGELSCKGFMSLQDFLLVGRVDDQDTVDEYKTGPEWIRMYETAKKQFHAYGLNPPLGSFVVTTRCGFGGPIGIIKKLTEIEVFGDKEYFVLESGDRTQEKMSYLVDKPLWTAYFIVIPESEKPREPEDIL